VGPNFISDIFRNTHLYTTFATGGFSGTTLMAPKWVLAPQSLRNRLIDFYDLILMIPPPG
jgi:hypothetical protein